MRRNCEDRIWSGSIVNLGILSSYEDAATRPERGTTKVRKGQFEGMPEKLFWNQTGRLDYGEIHSPNCWSLLMVLECRLIAYNINLQTIWKLPTILQNHP